MSSPRKGKRQFAAYAQADLSVVRREGLRRGEKKEGVPVSRQSLSQDEDKDEQIDQDKGSPESGEPETQESEEKAQNDGKRWHRQSCCSAARESEGIETSLRSSCSHAATAVVIVVILHEVTCAGTPISIRHRDPGKRWRQGLVFHVTGEDLMDDAPVCHVFLPVPPFVCTQSPMNIKRIGIFV